MTSEPLGDSEEDVRFNVILAEFIQQMEAGTNPNPQEILERHPEYAEELKDFFSDKARFDRMAEPFKPGADRGPQSMSMDNTLVSTDSKSDIGFASAPELGTRLKYFGDYELLEEVARGGMGVVYKARQSTLKRIVALKMILAGQFASNDDVKRFYSEAEAAAKLEHPNIVPIFEIGQAESQHYFSMAFVEGESLAHRVVREVLSPKEAAKIMHTVAGAIAYAHVEGVVHRDLKPANILLDKSGEPHVTDFGLAKRFETAGAASDAASQLTATGQVLGTPSYMPPEQASGRAKEIGPLADVYSLGAVLYCLITGRPPFQAASPLDTLLQVIEQDPVAPRLLNPSIPRDLETICLKCLNKDPRQRYGTAAELADDLGRFVNDEPILARPPDMLERAWRWAKKQHRSVALTAVAVAATLVLGGVGVTSWVWYQDWRLGYVALGTDRPPLAAEILDESGQPVAKSFTVPTQEPVAVPAGDYWLRLSAEGRMSQSYRMSVRRGANSVPMKHSLNIDDQLLGTSLAVDQSYALVQRNGRTDVVLLDATGIRYPGWLGNGPAFATELSKPVGEQVNDTTGPGLRWPWNVHASNPELAHHIFHPQVVVDAPDLDGDGIEDVIVAARHQAWIMAIPSRGGGGVLWIAARGSDLTAEAAKSRPAWSGRNSSSVLGAPLVVKDVDGDGVSELIAVFGDESQGQPAAPQRWVECLSGRSGKTVWRFDLNDELFQLLPGAVWPASARWMTEVTGYSNSGSGGGGGGYPEDFMSIRPNWQIGGAWHPAPFAPQLVRVAGQLTLVVIVGKHLLGIDPATGKPTWEPFYFGFYPVREPQFADLDGDHEPELILLEATQIADARTSASAPPSIGTPSGRGLKFTAWSTSARRMNWRHDLTSEWTSPRSQDEVPPEWPLIADLDGDGKSELIVPAGSQLGVAPWGEIEVLDGQTGNSLWRRRIKTMDQQLDKFLVGPDTDGDGFRDLFVASLSGQKYELFIDALSGKDGNSVWRSNKKIGTHSLGSIRWWQSGDDFWPQLLVEVLPENRNGEPKVVYSFASRDGRYLGSISGMDQIRFGDADADGLPDLFAFQQNNWRDPRGGGKLQALRGEPTERWRRLGGVWTAAADYDGDGHVDVVALERGGSPLLTAVSGSDGHRLWVTPLESRLFDNAIPLQVDLDGDGTNDIVTRRAATQSVTAGGLKQDFPVAAVSGRTGAMLWSVPMSFSAIERVLFADAKDLDGDGVAEVAFSAMTDWDYDNGRRSGTNLMQHWLAVVSGRTGQIRWRKPLSVAYGKPGQPDNRNYQTGNTDLRPGYGDFNGDGTLDFIVPAETVESPNAFELRAMSGRDGEVIWRRRLHRGDQDFVPTPNGEQLADAVSPVIIDLDRDGQHETIGLDYVMKKMPPPPEGKSNLSVIENQALHGALQRHANLFALNAADGREKWSVPIAVEEQCGKIGWQEVNLANKPRPILLRTSQGPPLIALGLWGWSNPGKIVLLTSDGKQLSEMSVQPEYYAFRPWVFDIDGDGVDELLVINAGKLQAIRANAQLPVIWEWMLPQGSDTFGTPRQIVGVIAASSDQPAVIAVQWKSTVYGISCVNGRVMWINRGPQTLTDNGALLVTNATLLSSPSDNRLPRVLFQFGDQLAACRDARQIGLDQKELSPDGTSVKTAVAADTNQLAGPHPANATSPAASERPARLHTLPPDPRLIRRSTLSPGEGERARALRIIGWGTLMSLFILLLPGWTLLQTIERRRWNLGSFFLLAVLATLVVIFLRVPGPSDFEPTDHSRPMIRFLTAITFLPIPVFTCLLTHLAIARRWRTFGLCVGGVLVISALVVTISLIGDFRRLRPEEHLALTDWDIPICYGFFAAGWIATILVSLMAVGRAIRRPLSRPMRWSSN